MVTEEVLMRAVTAGGDRQDLHERIRQHSLAAKDALLAGATRNDLLDRLRADAAFAAVAGELDDMLAPERHVGLAVRQTERYLEEHVEPALEPYREGLGMEVALEV